MLSAKQSILHSTYAALVAFAFAGIPSLAGAQVAAASGQRPVDPALPDSPGATIARQEVAPRSDAQVYVAMVNSQEQAQAAQAQSPQTQAPQTPATPQQPVGTAAAPAPNASGVAASQPAGVAIAPAKQHRTRTLILRTGAIIAGAAAIGTVVALSEATSSKPPGAH